MNITEITDIIQAYSDATATTTEPTVFCCSKTLAVSTTKTVAGLVRETATLDGTLPVQIVDNPSAGLQKQISNIVIHNVDTVTHTIYLQFFDGTDTWPIYHCELLTNEQAIYSNGAWSKYDSNGNIVTVGEAGAAGTDGSDGALTVTEVEIDFGGTPVFEKQITVTDAGVSASSKIIATQSGKAATGKDADENQMDFLLMNCTPASGQFVINAKAIPGPVSGLYKINYQFS